MTEKTGLLRKQEYYFYCKFSRKSCVHQENVMQHGPPKFILLPATGFATGLSDSGKACQVVLKVPSTVDLSIALTVPTITAREKENHQKKDSTCF